MGLFCCLVTCFDFEFVYCACGFGCLVLRCYLLVDFRLIVGFNGVLYFRLLDLVILLS